MCTRFPYKHASVPKLRGVSQMKADAECYEEERPPATCVWPEEGLGFSLGSRVWGLGFGVWGLGLRV